MSPSPFKDRRASGLLNRVREDISHLREDIGSLLTHTTRTTLPNGARELADQARTQIAAGGAYAASRFRNLRVQPTRQSAGWIGGAVVVGLLAFGAYALIRNCPCNRAGYEDDLEPEDDAEDLT